MARRWSGHDFQLRGRLADVHTPQMTLKLAALFALLGTILMAVSLTWTLVSHLLNVLRDAEPLMVLVPSFIYALGSLTLVAFFFVFHNAQS
jgi:hypothetical protein